VHVHVARCDERQPERAAERLQRRETPPVLPGGEELDRDPQSPGEDRGEPRRLVGIRLGGWEPEGQETGESG
jgi:hypothetical protein